MRSLFSDEIKTFISENISGRRDEELTQLVNKTFGTSYRKEQIKYYRKNNHLKSGLKSYQPVKLFPDAIDLFIRENVIGRTTADLTLCVNKAFCKNYTEEQILTYKKKHHIKSGLTGYFEKGSLPKNNYQKGTYTPGCEKGWFQKGQVPYNHKPIGSERIDAKDGYTLIKTAEPNVWELKHTVIWQTHFGAIPKGYKIMFLDGNRQNLDIKNLEMVKNDELLMLSRRKLRFSDPLLTQSGILIAKILTKKSACLKQKKEQAKKKSS